jgi:hypothetical protein
MNDQDLDLLLALAEGRLSAADAEVAQTRLSTNPNLVAELEIQRLVVDRLRDLPMPALTEAESRSLRAALRDELHLEPAVAPVAAGPRRRSWLFPLTGLATAAVVLLGVLYIVPRTGDDSSGEDVVAVATFATADEAGTAPPAALNNATEDAAEFADEGTSPPDEPSPDDTPTDDATAGTAQTEPTETQTDEAAGNATDEESTPAPPPPADEGSDDPTIEVAALDTGVPTADELVAVAETRPDDPEGAIAAYLGSAGSAVSLSTADLDRCAAALDSTGAGRVAEPVATGTVDGRRLAVILFPETSDAALTVSVLDLDDCDVLSTATAGS